MTSWMKDLILVAFSNEATFLRLPMWLV